MIRLVSSVDQRWNPATAPFYLELYGETDPTVNLGFAQVLGSGPADDSHASASRGGDPVYEYWWTLAFHRDQAREAGHQRDKEFFDRFNHKKDALRSATETTKPGPEAMSFEDPAAWIGLYFPTTVNWRVKEIAATLKFLTPVTEQHQLWQDISDNIAKLAPLVADAGSLASLAPGGSGASTVLSTVAKLQVGSVPQSSVKWSVEKTVHVDSNGKPWQGIEWRLPHDVFDILGGRVSGSVAVTFMEALGSQRRAEC